MVDLEGAHLDPLDRLDHEVRQIILRDPVPKIGRKQKRLVPLAVDKFAHGEILTENLPKVRHTARLAPSDLNERGETPEAATYLVELAPYMQ